MLNQKNERELAYLVSITDVTAMDADRLECAHIDGWKCVVGKGEFRKGDIAVFFEIDSQLPETSPFCDMEFLVSKKYKIKSQRIRGVVSQGLLVPVTAFGWKLLKNAENGETFVDTGDDSLRIDDESRFLTKRLGVTYTDPSDNVRKASNTDKYKSMASRHQKIAKTRIWRWLYKRMWGKKLLFVFFGRKRDRRSDWPTWVVKTDEERIQNCTYILNDTEEIWYPTEKIDGSSTTFTLFGYGHKQKFLVCSRNVVFDKPNKKCFYDTNIYTEMAEKYNMEEVMKKMLDSAHSVNSDIKFLTIQAETYGAGVQRRDYGLKGHDMAIFNIIWGFKDGSTQRLNPLEGRGVASNYGLPYVPVLSEEGVHLPNDCDAVLEMAGAEPSKIDGGMREGIVFRSKNGKKSFKAVSNEFLLKYHG